MNIEQILVQEQIAREELTKNIDVLLEQNPELEVAQILEAMKCYTQGMVELTTLLKHNLSDIELERKARRAGCNPITMKTPTWLVTLGWLRWAYNLGRLHGK